MCLYVPYASAVTLTFTVVPVHLSLLLLLPIFLHLRRTSFTTHLGSLTYLSHCYSTCRCYCIILSVQVHFHERSLPPSVQKIHHSKTNTKANEQINKWILQFGLNKQDKTFSVVSFGCAGKQIVSPFYRASCLPVSGLDAKLS